VGDLLIRNLEGSLKQQLQARARQNGRSLSEEAAAHLRRSLAISEETGRPAGDWLRGLLGAERWSDEELEKIEASRHDGDREPPSFEE
jgi:antitoxin FitA